MELSAFIKHVYIAVIFIIFFKNICLYCNKNEPSKYLSVPTTNVALGSGEMFNNIANIYDAANIIMSLNLDTTWGLKLIQKIHQKNSNNRKILDMSTGTGHLPFLMADYFNNGNNESNNNKKMNIIGIDPSEKMLDVAHYKLKRRIIREKYNDRIIINFEKGSAEKIKYSNSYFDGITMKFGIRNVNNRKKSLKELKRVLKSKGYLMILEFVSPSQGVLAIPAQMFISFIIPLIGYAISFGNNSQEYNYLRSSIYNFPNENDFLNELDDAGFINCKYHNIFAWTVILFECSKK